MKNINKAAILSLGAAIALGGVGSVYAATGQVSLDKLLSENAVVLELDESLAEEVTDEYVDETTDESVEDELLEEDDTTEEPTNEDPAEETEEPNVEEPTEEPIDEEPEVENPVEDPTEEEQTEEEPVEEEPVEEPVEEEPVDEPKVPNIGGNKLKVLNKKVEKGFISEESKNEIIEKIETSIKEGKGNKGLQLGKYKNKNK